MRAIMGRSSIAILMMVVACEISCVRTPESSHPRYSLKSLTDFSTTDFASGAPAVPSPAAVSMLKPGPPGPIHNLRCVPCGAARWMIKTLSDPQSSSVNYSPQATTVAQLNDITPPSDLNELTGARSAPTESQTYTVDGWLVGWRLEADLDIHLALEDHDGVHTMIAEVPSTKCQGACTSSHRDQFERVSQQLTQCLGTISPAIARPIAATVVEVTGVGFFDINHGQYGVAQNGIELHPVLDIKWISGPCPRSGGNVQVTPGPR